MNFRTNKLHEASKQSIEQTNSVQKKNKKKNEICWIFRKVVQAFKQNICGFDLLRTDRISYVVDVNGFSFVKNSGKYYDDCALILARCHRVVYSFAGATIVRSSSSVVTIFYLLFSFLFSVKRKEFQSAVKTYLFCKRRSVKKQQNWKWTLVATNNYHQH